MSRILAAAVVAFAILIMGAGASAHCPPYEEAPAPHRPALEWSTWVRFGGRSGDSRPPLAVPRTAMPAPTEDRAWSDVEGALGADLSLGVAAHGDVRLGGWAEATTNTRPVAGGELVIAAAPKKLDLFQFEGQGILVLRAGGNRDVITGAIAYGYLAPWKLWGPWRGATRYMIGVRLVVTGTRSRVDANDWWLTAGIEFEPIGSIRYLFGIHDWY